MDTRLTQVTPDQVLRWAGENQQRTGIADLTSASDGGLWVLGADDGLFARPFLRKVGGTASCRAEGLRYLSELSSRFERRQSPTSMTTARNGSFYGAFMGVGRVYVARFSEATCAVDETVGDRGVFAFAVPGLRTVTDIRVHRDAQDRVLVGVAVPGQLLLRRLDVDGSWDATFGNAGLATNPNSDGFWMSHITSGADGSIFVSGAVSIPFAFQPAILKLDASGRPVASFGTNGVQRYPEPSLGTGTAGKLLVESNQIVVGMTTGRGLAVDSIVTNDGVVAAIDPVSGRLLPSFGEGGFLRWDWGYSNVSVRPSHLEAAGPVGKDRVQVT